MLDFYILKGKIPVICPDMESWSKWMSEVDRHVKKEYIGDYWVSTVFLGIDHNWGAGNPILFETMVFDNGRSETLLGGSEYHPTIDNYFQRYSTWEQAEDAFQRTCFYDDLNTRG